MMVIDFQHEGSPVVRCLVVGWSGSGGFPFRSVRNLEQDATVPSGRPLKQPGWGRRSGQKEGVHNVHTLGFGSGRMSAGLGRIAEVSGGVADIQGLERGSSPTSGTCFPCSGACGPLSVHKLFTYWPLRGSFLLAGVVAGWLLSSVVDGSGLATSSGCPPRLLHDAVELGGDVP